MQTTWSYHLGETQVIPSLSFSQDEILKSIVQLHCPDGIDVDCTYGNGMFYKSIALPTWAFDLDPLHPQVLRFSSTKMPLPSDWYKSVMFDPPFLTYVNKGREHNGKVAMTSRFGGYWSYAELEAHYVGTIVESARILKKRGVLIVKCQDIIHNHRMHCTHANVIQWGAANGFRLKDLFVLGAKSRMPGPQKGQQRHARVFHSYFLVLERL